MCWVTTVFYILLLFIIIIKIYYYYYYYYYYRIPWGRPNFFFFFIHPLFLKKIIIVFWVFSNIFSLEGRGIHTLIFSTLLKVCIPFFYDCVHFSKVHACDKRGEANINFSFSTMRLRAEMSAFEMGILPKKSRS